jgi:hypothetical protein
MRNLKLITLSLLLAVFTACSSDDDNTPPLSEEEQIALLIQEVRNTTATFTNINAAMSAGWNNDLSGCVEHPAMGGMGHHYARMEFMDGRVNHLEPQVLLYAMNENEQMEFLGVEYIVPFGILPADADPPVLFFHEFHANHHLGIWALHVWTEKENSSGMFADWNPSVSCDNWINFLLNQIRTATTAYHDFNAGMNAGWNNQLSDCVEHPTEGGMGYHFGRMEYFDGRVNHLEPQVLLYNQDENDEWEFLGVEYIVPFAIHPADAEPPRLFNQQFHQNPNLEFWALHVWTEKENPSGIFNDWNPNVSCN